MSKRRAFLRLGLCAAAQAGAATAGAAPGLQTDLPQLRYPGNWAPYPQVMESLGALLRLRTRIEAKHRPGIVDLRARGALAKALFETPFLYVAGQETLPALQAPAATDLRRFVDFGGLLVFDDASGGTSRSFRRSVQAWIEVLFPASRLTKVAPDHVLYRSFYVLKRPAGRTAAFDHCLAVQEEGRIKVLYLPNDLGGALARTGNGFLMPCAPGGEMQREWAQRFAVNLLLYATCTDYKSDPAHVETLLRRRRWQ